MKQAFYKKWCDKKTEVYCTRRSLPLSAHYHQGVEIVYCEAGTTEFVLEGKRYFLETGAVLSIDSYGVHSCPVCGTIRTVLLPPPYLGGYEAFKQHCTLQSPCIPPGKDAERIAVLMEQLADDGDFGSLEVQGLCDQLLGSICRVCGLTEQPENSDAAMHRRLLVYLGEHFKEPLTLEQTAQALSYSRYYISRTLNRLVGVNFNTFLNLLRIRAFEAAVREAPRRPIPALAADCGFQSTQTFYRAFRKLWDMTPREYVKKLQMEENL